MSRFFLSGLLPAFLFLLISVRVGLYAQPSPALSSGNVRHDSLPAVALPEKAYVTKVVQLHTNKPEAALGDYIRVEVAHIHNLLRTPEDYHKPLVLFFNGIPMHGIYAGFISSRDNSIIFKLTRDTLSLKAWNVFYQSQTLVSKRKVSVSVGFENDTALDTMVRDFTLILVRKHLLMIFFIAIVVVIGLFIMLVKRTGILRDDNAFGSKGGYFSLSRTQLAFWTFIIITSFLYIWVVTGELPPITGSTLILLSISLSTTAAAKIVDTSRTPLSPVVKQKSEGFFKDILSDYNGVSIHRFQMVLWTIVIGFCFIRGVMRNLAMPQFDETLLLLMGISNGAYIGLKIPEKGAEYVPPPQSPDHRESILPVHQGSEDQDMPAVG